MKTEEQTDSRIVALQKKVQTAVAGLAAILARYRESESALTKNKTELSAAQADATKYSTARAELESASAVVLHRRGLSAQQAAEEADKLKGLAETAQARVDKEDKTNTGILQQQQRDFSEIKKILSPLNYDCALLVEAEFVAEIGAMIDLTTENVPELTDGHYDRLFAKTKAHGIYDNRTRLIKGIETDRRSLPAILELAEQIVQQPLVPVRQYPPKLPSDNCRFVQSIEQTINQEPVAPAATFNRLPTAEEIAAR